MKEQPIVKTVCCNKKSPMSKNNSKSDACDFIASSGAVLYSSRSYK